MYIIRYLKYDGLTVEGKFRDILEIEKGIPFTKNPCLGWFSATLFEMHITNLEVFGFETEKMEKIRKNQRVDWCNDPHFEMKDGFISKMSMSFNVYDENDIEGAIVVMNFPWYPTRFKCSGDKILDRDGDFFVGILREGQEVEIILPEEIWGKEIAKRKVIFKEGKLFVISTI